jgi:hypothetical protein
MRVTIVHRLLRSTHSKLLTGWDLTTIVQIFIEAELFHGLEIFSPVKFDVLLDFVAFIFADVTFTLEFFTVVFDLLLRLFDLRNFTFQLIERVLLLFQFFGTILFHFVASLRINQQFLTRFFVFVQLFA